MNESKWTTLYELLQSRDKDKYETISCLLANRSDDDESKRETTRKLMQSRNFKCWGWRRIAENSSQLSRPADTRPTSSACPVPGPSCPGGWPGPGHVMTRRHLPADTIASIYWLGRDHLHHHRLRARGPALDTLCMSSTLHRERRAAVLRSAPGSGAVVGEDSETKETLTGSVGRVKSTNTFRFYISAGFRYDSGISQCHKFDSSFKVSRR